MDFDNCAAARCTAESVEAASTTAPPPPPTSMSDASGDTVLRMDGGSESDDTSSRLLEMATLSMALKPAMPPPPLTALLSGRGDDAELLGAYGDDVTSRLASRSTSSRIVFSGGSAMESRRDGGSANRWSNVDGTSPTDSVARTERRGPRTTNSGE
jgi:hypothetical protein